MPQAYCRRASREQLNPEDVEKATFIYKCADLQKLMYTERK